MNIKKASSLLLSLGLSASAWAQTKDLIDVRFYHLQVGLDLDKKAMKGQASLDLHSTEGSTKQVILELSPFWKISKIEGAESFEHKGEKLIIQTNTPVEKDKNTRLVIHYEGEGEISSNQKGILYSTHGTDNQPIIAAIGYPNAAYSWFPCHQTFTDKADSVWVDVSIADRKTKATTPDGKTQQIPFTAVSNGVLSKTSTDAGVKTFQWRHRHSIHPQHVFVAVSNFVKIGAEWKSEVNKDRFAINNYLLPEHIQEADAMMNRAPEILTCFTNTFGQYPFQNEGFNIIDLGLNFGMDGIPAQGAVLLEDMKAVNMYKLTHNLSRMWFGCYLSPETWRDVWITESFASYAEGIWQEYKRGLGVLQLILDQKEYLGAGKLYPDKLADYSDERIYKKGMQVIHVLRGTMGDAAFFQLLKSLGEIKRLKKKTINTNDLQKLVEYYTSEQAEQDYSFFFDEWVKGEFYPTFHLVYETPKKGTTNVRVYQTARSSTPNLFSTPIPVKLLADDGVTTAMISESWRCGTAEKVFTFNKTITEVDFDNKNWVFKELLYTRHILNTKTPIEKFNISTARHNRDISISFESPKKQDVSIELVLLADGADIIKDTVIATQTFPAVQGAFSKTLSIPVDLNKSGNFGIKVVGKSDIFRRRLRLKQAGKQAANGDN